MSARFFAAGLGVYDRKHGSTVCFGCRSSSWAKMIADGLNMIVDQVAPWSPGAAHVDILDGEVIEDNSEQKAIGWHDEPLSSL
jgi:hypothetical protein